MGFGAGRLSSAETGIAQFKYPVGRSGRRGHVGEPCSRWYGLTAMGLRWSMCFALTAAALGVVASGCFGSGTAATPASTRTSACRPPSWNGSTVVPGVIGEPFDHALGQLLRHHVLVAVPHFLFRL